MRRKAAFDNDFVGSSCPKLSFFGGDLDLSTVMYVSFHRFLRNIVEVHSAATTIEVETPKVSLRLKPAEEQYN